MPTNSPIFTKPICLADNSSACLYLEKLAPLFDIEIKLVSEFEVELVVFNGNAFQVSKLEKNKLYRRLLAELCSKTLKWITYRQSESIVDTFFNVPEERMMRIAHLYKKSKSATQ